jgi:phosphatidylglycerophosphatase A
MKSAIAEVWSTAFYAGYVPKAPGTAGALAGVGLAWLLHQYAFFVNFHFPVLALALLAPSVWAAGVVIGETREKDPQTIVMDEVLGQLVVFLGAARFTPLTFVVAFAAFRLFDIWKPFPVNLFERLPGAWGVMMDDLMAGLYGAFLLWVLREFAGLAL